MKHQELLATAGETLAYAEDYLDTRIELLKLTAAEKGSLTAANVLAGVVVAFLGTFALMCFTVTLAILIGDALGSIALGYAIMGLIYAIIAVVLFVMRKKILVQPILKSLINSLFKDQQQADGKRPQTTA